MDALGITPNSMTGLATTIGMLYHYEMADAEDIAREVKDIVSQVSGSREISLEKFMPEFNVLVNREKKLPHSDFQLPSWQMLYLVW